MKLTKLMIPALLSGWFLLQAGPLAQAYSGIYYVKPSSISLRECPANNCAPLLTVYQSEKVEILERTATGWTRVKLVDRPAIGWIPSDFLSYSPDLQDKPVPPYHVNSSSLDLRDKPNPNANVVVTLHFNDPVEMLGVSSGWAQVRDLRTSVVGWADPRYLSSAASDYPKSSHRRRAPARKAAPKEEKPAPEETPKPPSPM
ncbi:MAG: SH3 domain-containing protein [Desulfobaccales bacterium]